MEPKLKSLFIAYLEGTLSKKDEVILIHWLQNNPDSFKEIQELIQIWNLSELVGKFNTNHIEKEWALLMQKVLFSSRKTKKSKGVFLYWLPRIAAVFLLGAIVSFAISYQILNPKNRELVYHEVSSPAGAKSMVTLPDGSSIWLNAGSNLKYSNLYGKKNREVLLSGEAFFDVSKDKSKVFIVKTSDLNIKAYGTSFNVKSYPEESTVETTLVEGSIGVTRTRFSDKKNDEVMLEPNQRVVYYKPSKSIAKSVSEVKPENVEVESEVAPKQKLTYLISKGIEAEQFISWKDGTLLISSETLKDLAVKLERKYDVKIHFENKEIQNFKFTGALENETIEQVIEAIGMAANIDYKIEERDIWIKYKN
ncbi:MAG: FecR family protein [Bacteroidetes bacterium]|nr:FecR family protein [Bacteroidota bacterium]